MSSTPNKGTPSRRQRLSSAVSPSVTPSRLLPPRSRMSNATRELSSSRTTPRKTPQKSTPRKTPQKSDSDSSGSASAGGEGIQVAIRMRPLNTNEGNFRRVWKVLPKYSSITQTTVDGKPPPEKINGRTFFTFDKTFGEEVDTKTVYNLSAKGIVDSVVSGLNGTIFAYGQTSSGKTFTMQGSGTIAEGSNSHTGGIVHMAANDIFEHIKANPDRIFLVRASFLEIYNEEVRDLLSPEQKVLQIREDPRRGVFVQSQEEYVTNYESLLQVLFTGEKSRAFAATAMNERSSRSHTIFRITIESRVKSDEKENENSEDDDDSLKHRPDGAVRVSTLNLVDLAGSESVRHTGATGDRQKEGGMINQSLLTLSRVIVALGQPNQMHVNFRDSKLTRILQPSLSGNARMAIICCATPSELYLEETRSTLAFASRAKLVKTNAKVNEVLDDRSLIRRLQKELAEARAEAGGVPTAKVKALEAQAATAGTAARQANEKLRKLQRSILNNQGLFAPSSDSPFDGDVAQRKRRRSDGGIRLLQKRTPEVDRPSSPRTLPRPEKKTRIFEDQLSLGTTELTLMREALHVKSRQVKEFQRQIQNISETVKDKENQFAALNNENELLESERDDAKTAAAELLNEISRLRANLVETETARDAIAAEKEEVMQEMMSKLEKELQDRKDLEDTVDALQEDIGQLRDQQEVLTANKTELSLKCERLEEEHARDESKLATITEEKTVLQGKLDSTESELQKRDTQLDEVAYARDELTAKMEVLKKEIETKSAENVSLQEALRSAEEERKSACDEFQVSLAKVKSELDESRANYATLKEETTKASESLQEALSESQSRTSELGKMCDGMKDQIEAQTSTIESLQKQLDNEKSSRISGEEEMQKKLTEVETSREEYCIEACRIQEELTSKKQSLETSLLRSQESAKDWEEKWKILKQQHDKEIALLKETLSEKEDKRRLCEEEAETRLDNIRCELQETQAALMNVQSTLCAENESLARSKERVEELDQQQKRLEMENTMMASELCKAQEENMFLATEIQNMLSQNEARENRFAFIHALALTRMEWIRTSATLTEQRMSDDLQRAKSLHASSLEQLDVINQQHSAALQQLKEMEVLCTDLQTENSKLSLKLDETIQLNEAANTESNGMRDKLDQMENQHKSLMAQMTNDHQQFLEREERLVSAHALALMRLQRLQGEALQVQQELTDKVDNLSSTLDATTAELERVNFQSGERDELLNTLENRVSELALEKNTITLKLSEVTEELKVAKSIVDDGQKELDARSAEITSLKNGKSIAEEHLLSKTEEVQGMTQLLDRLNVEISELENVKASLTRQLDETENCAKATDANRVALQAELQEAITKMTSVELEKTALETELESIKRKAEEGEVTNEVLERENEAMKTEIDKLRIENSKASEELSTNTCALHELTNHFEELKKSLVAFETESENLKSEVTQMKERYQTVRDDLERTCLQRNELNVEISTKTATIDTLEKTAEVLRQDLESTLKEKRNVDIGRDLAFRRVTKLEEATDSRESETNGITAILRQRDAELESLQKSIEDANDLNRILSIDLESAREEITILASSKSDLQDEVDEALKSKADVDSRIDLLGSQISALTEELELARETGKSLMAERDTKSQRIESLQNENADMATRLQNMNDSLKETSRSLMVMQDKHDELQASFDAAERRNMSLETARSIALARLQQLETGNDAEKEDLHNALAEIEVKTAECEKLREQIQISDARVNELETGVGSMAKEIDQLQKQNQELSENLDSHESIKCRELELEEKLQNTLKEKDDLIRAQDELRQNGEEAVEEALKIQKDLESEKVKSEGLLRSLRKLEDDQNQHNARLNSLQQLVAVKESKIEMQASEISSLQADKLDLKQRDQNFQSRIGVLESSLEDKENKLVNAFLRMEELESQIKQLVTEQEENTKRVQDALSVEKASLEQTISSLESERQALKEALEHALAESSSRADELIKAHELVESSHASTTTLKKQIVDLEDKLASQDTMLNDAYRALEEEKATAKESINKLSLQIAEMTSGTGRSRVQADDELAVENNELKGRLEAVMKDLEEIREAKEDAQNKFNLAQKRIEHLENSIRAEEHGGKGYNDGETLASVDAELVSLRSQIQEFETLLEQEKQARAQVEDLLTQRDDEERRALIQEAEDAMESLRSENEKLQSTLEKCESEAYAARQLTEELRDENKQHIDKSIQMQSRLAALENENSRLKRSTARFEEERDSQASALKSELKRAREQAASTRDSQHALESRLKVYEERLGQKDEEIQKLLGNMEVLDVPGLERKIKGLETELERKESRLLELEDIRSQVDSLNKQVEELSSELSTKDDRIALLKKSALTRHQRKGIESLKAERKEIKRKLGALQKENEELQMRLNATKKTLEEASSVDGTNTRNVEMTELKFNNEALERKLRKYSSKNQLLQEEHDSIKTVLQSNKIKLTDTGSIGDAIVQLVDRLASLEEECDSLSRSENQATSYLVEIEKLRQHNKNLHSQLTEAQRKANENSLAQIKTNERLRSLEQTLEAEKQEAYRASSSVADEARKLRREKTRLEEENLQLMQDLKARKEELHNLRYELNSLRHRSPSVLQSRADPSPFQSGALVKNSVVHTRRAVPSQIQSTVHDKVHASPAVQNNENAENRSEHDAHPDPGSSRKRRPTPGLGETQEENNDEPAQQCTQS